MAEKRISELSDAAIPLAVGSLFAVSEPTGSPGVFQSRKIEKVDLINSLGLAAIALSGLAADLDENTITIGSTAIALGDTVTLAKADVGLSNVDNTSDVGKPVSTAQQTALNLKADLVSPALTGTPTAPTASAGTNSTQVATTAYADAAAAAIIAAADVMVFKGVIDCSANPNYPAANRGDTYRVSVAGKIGGASGVNVEAGDILICLTDGTASGTQAAVGTSWSVVQANLDGAVIGPASAVDSRIAAFNGTTGKLLKDGGILTSAILVSGGTLGTPSSGTLTNATGLPISTGISGLAAGVASFLGTPSSANLAAALTDKTGTGAAVFAVSPVLTTTARINRSTNGAALTLWHNSYATSAAISLDVFNTGTGNVIGGADITLQSNGGTERLRAYATGDIRIGTGVALATTATDGFLSVPCGAGPPTGVPTNAGSGQVQLYVDKTNFQLCAYISGVGWKKSAVFT